MSSEQDTATHGTGQPPVSDWTTDYDILDPDYVADPYPVWDDLREQCPIAHSDRWGGSWLPTRYEDVQRFAQDHVHFSSRDVGVLSFGGSKLLSAGRGGALLTNRDDVVQRNRLYTQRGNEAYPLSELQATVLRPQLAQLDEYNRTRNQTVESLLQSSKNNSRFSGLKPFQPRSGDESAWYKLGLLYDESAFGGLTSGEFATAMRAEGVALFPGFDALQSIHSRRRFRAANDLPVSARTRERVLVLHHPILLEGPRIVDPLLAAIEKIRISAQAVKEHLRNADAR